MKHEDICTDLFYAVEYGSGIKCVRVIDTDVRVKTSNFSSGPEFARTETRNSSTGYATVTVDLTVDTDVTRAREITLADFLAAESRDIAPGLRLGWTQRFTDYLGPYDTVQARRDHEAKEEARRLEERQKEADESARRFAFYQKRLESVGVRVTAEKTHHSYGPQVTFGGSVNTLDDLGQLAELAEIGQAAMELYNAAEFQEEGYPTFMDDGKVAIELWMKIHKILPPF